MNIGIIIGRIGGVDGVALETEKWIDVLHRMGHKTYIIAGEFQERKRDPEREELALEMSFFQPEAFWGQKKAFFKPDNNIDELKEHIDLYSNVIADKIVSWAKNKKIDILISENASALPAHLEMGVGVKKAVERSGIPTITHDHDFAWERGDRYVSPHKYINDLIAETFPLRLPNVFHAVINTNAKNDLKRMFNRDSIVVPNVMDFDIPYALLRDDNLDLPQNLGLNKDDIPMFQITRVVRRKGIEVAIDLIHKLDDKRMKLVITGSAKDDEGAYYYKELLEQIDRLKLNDQVIWGSEIINNTGATQNGRKSYSLSDAYAHARACTYFSTYEGFGNAFVEAVLAKKPIFVNNYEPVYWPDIGSKGFKTVMLEDNNLTADKVEEMREILLNEKLNKEIAEYNFALGKKHFSYDVLEEILTELIERTKKL